MSNNYRMYVIVNKDMGKKIHKRGMTKSYQHVQASHVVADYILKHQHMSNNWNNGTLIVLGATRRQFNYYIMKLSDNIMSFSYFQEPDLDNDVTALACVVTEMDFKIFNRLELL